MADGRLSSYRSKRDFRRTPEPRGRSERPRDRPRFVIHRHAASSLHHDLRLELDGVLKSWAVPKGPSTDPRHKRLALEVEDHPLDYLDFEGAIPADEYGGGSVIVWDAGTWGNLTNDEDDEPVPATRALASGHLSVWLEGLKLTGAYALTRFRGVDQWLLVKHRDEGADARRNPVSTEPRSVLSGRTTEEVAFEKGEGDRPRDGRLGHPRFLGLRTDKDPAEVVRERPA